MLSIRELLTLRGLDTQAKIKLVRHLDQRYNVHELMRRGQLEIYQSYQSKPVFECDYVVAFVGMPDGLARLFGIFKIAGRCSANEVPLPPDFLYPDMSVNDIYFYELPEMPGFEDLKHRVVIDWGKSAILWHQWLTDKDVVQILPQGYVCPFPGYLDFVLTFDELVEIIVNPIANREWHTMLSAVAAVYLIVDTKTGRQYVGSASGEHGLLGRWRDYAKTVHGGNKELRTLVESDPQYGRNFNFTVLRTLPKTLTRLEVIEYERLYKKKLGTRAFGLNSN